MNRLLIALIAIATVPLAAKAQYPNPYVNPYNPYYRPYGGAGYGYGQALQGAASVQQAYGQVIQDQEQARILREQANQAKLVTKKQAFDLMQYEKANTPSYTETLTKEKAQIIDRIMNFPLRGEIEQGKTLNILFPYIQTLSTYGTVGQPVAIPQSIINELNISSTGTSSVGMLRDGGHLDWPLAFRGEYQKKLDKLLPAAVDAVLAKSLEPKLMKQIRTEMTAMRQKLGDQLRADEVETSDYLQAIQFYNLLDDSVNALTRPDARKQLTGGTSPRARNVQELVDYMTDNGLKFAPASPGNENAYQVVHDAFVRYARTAQAGSGFHSPVAGSGR